MNSLNSIYDYVFDALNGKRLYYDLDNSIYNFNYIAWTPKNE